MPIERAPGSFRHSNRARAFELQLPPEDRRGRRVERILASIQADLSQGGTAYVRQILAGTRELYRLELELPEMGYQRITILDREALTTLLEETTEQELRERFTFRYTS